MKREEIVNRLWAMQDAPYGEFQKKLLPNVAPERVIGVRTPEVRKLAREIAGDTDTGAFLRMLPHQYFDENQVHAFLLCQMKDFDACLAAVEAFLPYVDNWATCDQLSPKCFSKHHQALLPSISRWLQSEHPYTIRFGVGMLMQHFLDGDFDPRFPAMVAALRSNEYYVNMMIAWYFATALAKQYDAALPYLKERRLDDWVHRKAIQKAVESYRIPAERKEYLKSLR